MWKSSPTDIRTCFFFFRDTMLQALRFVTQGAGAKVDAAVRKNITTVLLGMLGHDEVLTGRRIQPDAG